MSGIYYEGRSGPLRSSRRRGTERRRSATRRPLVVVVCLIFMLTSSVPHARGFSLPEWLVGNGAELESTDTLSLLEISDMRVRDIKRRLSRQHGYGADELARMLDKKELINALSYEEHKVRQREAEARKRFLFRRSIIVALIAVIMVMFWPLFSHLWEVLCINFVVYTDKKKHEISRCRELHSVKGCAGILSMFIVDLLSLWLSVSILLSWVMRSKYFFPIPSLPIRPAALLAASTGGTAGGGGLSRYGINVGPMIVSWALRYINGKFESWTGKVFLEAQKRQKRERKQAKKQETDEEREARRAARATRRAEREARKQAAAAAAASQNSGTAETKTPDDDFGANAFPDDIKMPSQEEFTHSAEDRRNAAAAAAEARLGGAMKESSPEVTEGAGFDDLD